MPTHSARRIPVSTSSRMTAVSRRLVKSRPSQVLSSRVRCSGRLQLDSSGRLWHGCYSLAPSLQAVSFEADRAAQVLPDPGVVVLPIVAVYGAQVPWGKVVMDGVPVVAARRLPSMLRELPAVLGPERVADLANQARVRFHVAT
jgi:hypothetical protein